MSIIRDVKRELAKLGLIYKGPRGDHQNVDMCVITPEGYGTFTIEPDFLQCNMWRVHDEEIEEIGGTDVDLETVEGAEAIAMLITQMVRWTPAT